MSLSIDRSGPVFQYPGLTYFVLVMRDTILPSHLQFINTSTVAVDPPHTITSTFSR
ncbi:hypothetical protein PS627_01672 [Pseudomonas fluorescens]|nr:hypothetical protein PS627_01672 [Pseudomonas fluorescens]VVP88083.1 hypothetical protein PS910_02615 [Pseudomonas fluorescens]